MKRKRHTPEQIIAKLHEADEMRATGSPVDQILTCAIPLRLGT